MTSFGDLRSLLQTPGPQLPWEQVWSMLERAPPSELGTWVGYVRGHQSRWQRPRECAVPPHALDALLSERDLPELAAAQCLSVRDRDLGDAEIFEISMCPYLDNLSILELGWNRRMPWRRERITYSCVRDLLKSQALSRITTLAITGQHLGADALCAILERGGFEQLTSLDFSFNDLAFLQAHHARDLHTAPRELSLRDCSLTLNCLSALREGQLFEHLTLLDLSQNQTLEPRDLTQLITLHGWRQLETLRLSHNGIPAEGLCAMLAALGQRSLRELDVSANALFAGGEQPLERELGSQLAGYAALQVLDLSATHLHDVALKRLLSHAPLTSLTSLSLAGNTLSLQSVGALEEWGQLERLAALDLSRNQLRDDGVRQLLMCCRGSRMRRLGLASNDFGDEAMSVLAADPMPQLEVLDLANNRLTLQGVQAIFSSGCFPGLRELRVDSNPIDTSAQEWSALQEQAALQGVQLHAQACFSYPDPLEFYDDEYE